MDEKERIADEEFLDILENNPNNTQQQIAEILRISQPAVSKRIRNLMEKGLISDKVQERANRNAFRYFKNLEKQSEEGNTQATVKLLEIAKIYVPASKHQLEGSDEKPFILEVINSSKAFKDRENYDDAKKEKSEVST